MPNPNDFQKPGEKPPKMRFTLTKEQDGKGFPNELEERAARREGLLKEARIVRSNRATINQSMEKNKREMAKKANERAMDYEELGKRNMKKEEKERAREEKEKAGKEDYKRRYKQLERNWLKFMVGMPILLVISYDLFQRLVMKREPKVIPWRQAKMKKEKEQKEREERKRLAMEGGGTEA
ncbi:hypothetical protein F53441_13276 [Fusarium austroafricanum]|uniref:Uncharacterized protein n=1 Tax=Fusarium austroafricanum TaxID=2364996 RepID=A0A8H4JP89_9HYPO|nr:hypothetical protein F53441_13276 [Fusarium austroafricanum]